MKRMLITIAVATLVFAVGKLWIAAPEPSVPAARSSRATIATARVEPQLPAPPHVESTRFEQRAMIERVTVDHTTVCAGQDALVTASLGPEFQHAEIIVNDAHANPAVVRYSQTGSHRIRVRAFAHDDGHRIGDKRDLNLQVVACPDKPQLWVVAQRDASSNVAEGQIVLQQGLEGRIRYEWRFGDGTVDEGTTREQAHKYMLGDAPAKSTYLVTVTATDEKGTKVTGRAHFISSPALSIARR